MIVQIVRFRSAMDNEQVAAMYERRAARYREVPGLVQKYYLAFPSGEHGAIYIWDSQQAMAAFRQSELARTIPEAYQVQGEPHVEVCEVVMALHPAVGADV